MVDAAGTTKYTYTAGNQLLTEDGPFASGTVTNTYVNRLRTKLDLTQPTAVWTNLFIYDTAARLTNVTSPAGVSAYEYSAGVGGASGYSSSLIKRLLLPNTSIITNNYDSVARLLGTYLRTSAGTLTNKHEYTYNLPKPAHKILSPSSRVTHESHGLSHGLVEKGLNVYGSPHGFTGFYPQVVGCGARFDKLALLCNPIID